MATIVPIAAVRYAPNKIGDMALVVTPPYDVIDTPAQARYYARHPYNIIRLELGQVLPQDDERNNRYSRAANYFSRWLEEGILKREGKPAFYLYQQEFSIRNERKIRTGFFAGLKVEDYSQGNVLPHEETLSKPKADRLQLLRACRANFSPIFGLYADPDHQIEQLLWKAAGNRPPDVEFTDENNEIHRLWVITNKQTIKQVQKLMQQRQIFIADGHHRYETSLNFRDEMHSQGLRGYDTVLATLVNLHDDGLVILPTHRLVRNLRQFNLADFKQALTAWFELEVYPTSPNREADLANFLQLMADRRQNWHVFGLYTEEKQLYLLTLRPDVALAEVMDKSRSTAFHQLDVAILDTLVLERILGIGSEQRKNQDNLTYTRDALDAITAVDEGSQQLAFFLNPTRVEEVTAVAKAGDKMPQKSTFFYPKLITGLVINYLE